MNMSETIDEKYKNAVNVINSAGGTPVQVTDNTVAILKYIVEEKHLDFIMAFKGKRSQSMEQLKESTGLTEDEINEHVKVLAKKGLIMNQPSSSGLMIYRLMPFVNVGVYEYTFMKKLEYNEWEKGLAQLYLNLNKESRGRMLANYDAIVKRFLPNMRPIDRTIPYNENFESGEEINLVIDEELEVPKEKIISTQSVEEIINKFEDIAVGYCFCRQRHQSLGHDFLNGLAGKYKFIGHAYGLTDGEHLNLFSVLRFSGWNGPIKGRCGFKYRFKSGKIALCLFL